MSKNLKHRTSVAVEKGFSSYVKSCLQHSSRDFFKKVSRDSRQVGPLNESTCELNVTLNFYTSKYMKGMILQFYLRQ
jgi:hypothetical protein